MVVPLELGGKKSDPSFTLLIYVYGDNHNLTNIKVDYINKYKETYKYAKYYCQQVDPR